MRDPRRLRHLPVLAVLAAGLAVLPAAPALAAPVALPSSTAAAETGPFSGDFYTPVATLPDANGAIIRYQDSAVAYLGVPAKRIMYKSIDVNNQPVAVSGTVLLPTEPWRGGGPRPLVSFAVGTQGQGTQCAPSILFN